MNLGIVYPSLGAVGGAENVVVWLAESLVKRGHRVVVFTTEFSETVWGTSDERSYEVHLLRVKKYRSTLKRNREAGLVLSKALSSYDLDLVNPHNYPASLWVSYAKTKRRDFPKILLYLHNLTRGFYEDVIDIHLRQLPGLRNAWNRYRPKKLFRRLRQVLFGYRRLDQEAVRACDRLLANSTYTAEVARKIYKRDVHPCLLGIPDDLYRNELGEPSNDAAHDSGMVRILTVARVEIQKNFDTLLKAIKIVVEKNGRPGRFLYKIAGGGPHLNYFKKKSRAMGIADIVHFVGPIPHAGVWKLYKDAAFLVHIPLDEPFGLVPLEAALMKKPSIVSDHGGPAEIVVNGETGFHVNALDPYDVAQRIEHLIKQPDTAQAMGISANKRVVSAMSWDAFMNNFEHHLNITVSKSFHE